MHPAGVRLAENDAGLAVVREPLKLGSTIFAFWRYTADSNFIAHYLDGLVAHDFFTVTIKKKKKNRKINSKTMIYYILS